MFDIFSWLADEAIAGKGEEIFGRKPGVANYRETDLGAEANKAVKSNLANYGDISALLERLLPGYGKMVETGSRNTQALLRGEIPQDVQDSIKRSSAYRSIQGGYAGSGMSKALTARDLGRTSLDLIDQGNNSAQRWMAITQGSASPYVVTAPAAGEAGFKNNLYRQAVDQFRLNVDAAPTPAAAGKFNLQTALGSMAASFGLGSAAGAIGGGSKTAVPATNTSTANNAYPYNWWGG